MNLKNKYTNSNKFLENGISSLMIVLFYSLKENTIKWCIYLKVILSKFLFYILYINDILFTTNNIGLLHKTKKFLSHNFKMKNMEEITYMIEIKIFQERS